MRNASPLYSWYFVVIAESFCEHDENGAANINNAPHEKVKATCMAFRLHSIYPNYSYHAAENARKAIVIFDHIITIFNECAIIFTVMTNRFIIIV